MTVTGLGSSVTVTVPPWTFAAIGAGANRVPRAPPRRPGLALFIDDTARDVETRGQPQHYVAKTLLLDNHVPPRHASFLQPGGDGVVARLEVQVEAPRRGGRRVSSAQPGQGPALGRAHGGPVH